MYHDVVLEPLPPSNFQDTMVSVLREVLWGRSRCGAGSGTQHVRFTYVWKYVCHVVRAYIKWHDLIFLNTHSTRTQHAAKAHFQVSQHIVS